MENGEEAGVGNQMEVRVRSRLERVRCADLEGAENSGDQDHKDTDLEGKRNSCVERSQSAGVEEGQQTSLG